MQASSQFTGRLSRSGAVWQCSEPRPSVRLKFCPARFEESTDERTGAAHRQFSREGIQYLTQTLPKQTLQTLHLMWNYGNEGIVVPG